MNEPRNVKSASKTALMGTDALFENYTIEEIQEIEKKTRMEIEKKKEELRQMVGERYRDFIEAADTIQAMRNSANCITGCIKNMVHLCENLPNQHTKADKSEQVDSKKTHLYGIGAQIKLLLDIPKEIWSYIDQDDYLAATKLYVFARHIHSHLSLMPSHGLSIQKNFPIINRQWAAIFHFRPSILQGCHSMLKETDQSEQKMVENVASLMLLEEMTPRQVFNQFLLARTKLLQDMFSLDKENQGAKIQICDVIKVILDTVYLVHALFYKNNADDQLAVGNNNFLCETLSCVTSQKCEGPLRLMSSDSPVMKYLPQSVTDFRPVPVISDANIAEQDIQSTSCDWMKTVANDVSKGFEKILKYVTTIRSLSSIRYSVLKLLSEDCHHRSWDNICRSIFTKPVNIWKEFVHPAFMAQTKEIIQCHLHGTATNQVQQLEKVLIGSSEVDYDLSTFIWTRQVADGVDRKGWLNSGNRPLSECGQLAMKANGFMPVIQRLCHSLDSRLKVLLEDLKFFVTFEDNAANKSIADDPGIPEKIFKDFDCPADNEYVFKFMQEKTVLCASRLISFIQRERRNIENSGCERLYRYALLGRFAVGLTELCPSLEKCLCFASFVVNPAKSDQKKLLKSNLKEQPVWYGIRNKLRSESIESFRLWSLTVTDDLMREFENSFSEKDDFTINHQPLWNEIEIQEENEEGNSIKSKIKIPNQISRNLMEVLIRSCSVFSQVGGHVMNKVIVKDAIVLFCQRLLKEYEKKIHEPVKQTRAIQMLFDVRYIIILFLPSEDQKSQQLIDKIENQIDPFDLDVFYPHIHANLKRSIQGSMVLLGLIIPNEKILLFGGSRTSSAHDQHNVLPLTTGHNSFSLLPISDTSHLKSNTRKSSLTRMSLKGSKKDVRTRSATPSPTRRSGNSSSSGMGPKSQSFYDRMTAMSNSWFGGQ